jgi:hypothetical protein
MHCPPLGRTSTNYKDRAALTMAPGSAAITSVTAFALASRFGPGVVEGTNYRQPQTPRLVAPEEKVKTAAVEYDRYAIFLSGWSSTISGPPRIHGLGIFRSVNELEGRNVSCIARSHRLSADHTLCGIIVITDFNALPPPRMGHRIKRSTTRAEEGSAFRDWPCKRHGGFP